MKTKIEKIIIFIVLTIMLIFAAVSIKVRVEDPTLTETQVLIETFYRLLPTF